MKMLKFRRIWMLIGYGLVAGVVVLSLSPAPPPVTFPWADKAIHMAIYAVLMLWFAQLHPKSQYGLLATAFIALGIVLEWGQSQTGYRVADGWDAVANGVGTLLSWGLALKGMNSLLYKLEYRWRKTGKERE